MQQKSIPQRTLEKCNAGHTAGDVCVCGGGGT
jgi:hypothetical protein